MKKIFTLLFALAFSSVAFTQNLFVDDVSYSGALTANGWTAHSVAGTNPISTTTGSLSFPSYPSSGIGNSVILGPSGEDVNKPLSSSVTTGTVYLSFLVTVSNTLTTTGDYFTGFYGNAMTFFGRVYVKKNADATFDFGIAKTSGTPLYTSGSFAFGTTYLVVAKYEFFTGSTTDDVASVFVFSAAAPSAEPLSNQTSNVGIDAAIPLAGVMLRQGSSTTLVNVTVDGIRAGTTWSNTLPVELVDFKAQKSNTSAKLNWQTASEQNNNFFSIERSQNGSDFDKIGEVKGNGNSIKTQNYSFVDASPVKGTNYYRLRQTDFDGKETVSKTVSVNFDGKAAKAKVYPTVVKDILTVELASDATTEILVRDITGRLILTKNTEGAFSTTLDLGTAANGLYFITVQSNQGLETVKVLKQ